ncbi:MAG TPA: FecR domain-containing protein [Rhizomicrobium sp.]|jgi:transmembrane sensor
MTRFRKLALADQTRLEEAAAWHLRLKTEPALELTPEFLDWMSAGENQRAWQAVEIGLADIAQESGAPELLALRRDALARARRQGAWRWLPRSTLRYAAAAVMAVGVVAGTLWLQLGRPDNYATGTGERRVVALPDGSRVSLDSGSQVRVRYSETGRSLELDHGRARFDVAHDVRRPFTVKAGNETVVAVGTSFNVEKLNNKIVVTLIQGHVVVQSSVSPSRAPQVRPVSLAAGEELVARADAPDSVTPANLQLATAWEAGRLVFHDQTLAEAVERVNRYTDQPLVVDPSVAAIRISGSFNAGDVGSFVSAVTSYFPVQATTTGKNNILLQRRS